LPIFNVLQQHLDIINYDVVAWSGYSADYHPRNIKENKPHDQASRWSSGSHDQLQYLTLKLERDAIIRMYWP
jgi:hypothetical protein